MKKILIFILCTLFLSNIRAYTYSDWSTVRPDDDPNFIISEKRYKWYKNEESNIEYLKRTDILNKNVDYNDYIFSEYIDLGMWIIDENEDIFMEVEQKTLYLNENDITDIYIYNIKGSSLKMSEIEAGCINEQNNEKNISAFENISHLINGNINDYQIIPENVNINIKVSNSCDIYDYKLDFQFISEDDESSFELVFDNKDRITIYKEIIELDKCEEGCLYNYVLNKNYDYNIEYIVDTYKYKQKLYRTYDIERVYADDYHTYMEGYIKDEDNYIVYYRSILDDIIYYNLHNQIVESEYCQSKEFCTSRIRVKNEVLPPEEEQIIEAKENQEKEVLDLETNVIDEIKVPKTMDNIMWYVIACIIIINLFLILFYYIKKYN